jgi:hypothetical protein
MDSIDLEASRAGHILVLDKKSMHIIVHLYDRDIDDNHQTKFHHWNKKMHLIDIVEIVFEEENRDLSLLFVVFLHL